MACETLSTWDRLSGAPWLCAAPGLASGAASAHANATIRRTRSGRSTELEARETQRVRGSAGGDVIMGDRLTGVGWLPNVPRVRALVIGWIVFRPKDFLGEFARPAPRVSATPEGVAKPRSHVTVA